MTTVVIIPVNQDTRPTAFYSSFETPDGVRVDLTIGTREQGVADAVTAKVGTLGWTQVSTTSITPLWQIPLMTALMLAVVGFALFLLILLLGAIGWLPHHLPMARDTIFDNQYMNTTDIVGFVLKWFGRGAIVALPFISGFWMWEELDSRKES